MTESEAYNLACDTANCLVQKHGIAPLSSFCYSEDHPLITAATNEARAKGSKTTLADPDLAAVDAAGTDAIPDDDDMKWPGAHFDAWKTKHSHGDQQMWWAPSPITEDVKMKYSQIASLTERELDLLMSQKV